MNGKKRFIENLTEKEHRSLTKGYKTGESPIYQRRCHCILLSAQRYTVNDLSSLFGVSINTIYDWFNRWEASGIQGLKLKSGRGRKKKLDTENENHVKVVKRLVENEPKQLNRVLVQIKSELDIEVSKKTLKRFLKRSDSSGNDLGVEQNPSPIQMNIKPRK